MSTIHNRDKCYLLDINGKVKSARNASIFEIYNEAIYEKSAVSSDKNKSEYGYNEPGASPKRKQYKKKQRNLYYDTKDYRGFVCSSPTNHEELAVIIDYDVNSNKFTMCDYDNKIKSHYIHKSLLLLAKNPSNQQENEELFYILSKRQIWESMLANQKRLESKN